jgi:hypothetical protein
MRRLALSFLAAAAGLSPSAPGQAQTPGHPNTYSLKTVEKNPIPRDEHFLLWREVALKACDNARSRFNLAEPECRQIVGARAANCAVQLAGSTPARITSTDVARSVGRQYLNCATPYYFCNGVEVKSEEEALVRCKKLQPAPPRDAASAAADVKR